MIATLSNAIRAATLAGDVDAAMSASAALDTLLTVPRRDGDR
jgi:hypothetical protein